MFNHNNTQTPQPRQTQLKENPVRYLKGKKTPAAASNILIIAQTEQTPASASPVTTVVKEDQSACGSAAWVGRKNGLMEQQAGKESRNLSSISVIRHNINSTQYQRLRQRGKQPLVKEHKSACGSASLGPRKKWQTWPKNLNGAQRSKGERAFLNSGTDLKTHFRNTIEAQS